jgi:hypothetical protein
MSGNGYIPVHDLNAPHGGPQQPASVGNNQPVYSSYTGNLVGYGPIPKGTQSDAPPGNPNHAKPYHVIVLNPANQSYMSHGRFWRR